MRGAVIAVCVLAGCDLYFGPSGGSPLPPADAPADAPPDARHYDAHEWPDALPPDAHPDSFTFAVCEGGKLYRSDPQTSDTPPASFDTELGACSGACASPGAVYDCLGDPSCAGASPWLCGNWCPAADQCGNGPYGSGNFAVPCAGAGACVDGLCSPIAVLGAIAGHWQGTVTPPSFSAPYTVDLVIAPDGHISPHRNDGGYGPAFYYGDDGANPDRWFRIAAITPSGAVGEVGVMFSYQEILPGLIVDLHVDAAHLSFTFWDSWLNCTRPFVFDLKRVP
jgi:hypothetical protein